MAEDIWNLIALVSQAKEELRGCGITTLTIERDFFQLLELAKSKQGLEYQHFDPHRIPQLKKRGFWICGRNEQDEIVHFQGCRHDDLGDGNLEDYMADIWPRLNSGIPVWDLPIARDVTGAAVYHGSLWIRKDLRRNTAGTWATRLGMLLAHGEYNADAIYGTATQQLALSPYGLSQGYSIAQPIALDWVEPSPWGNYWCFIVPNAHVQRLLRAGFEQYAPSK
ncbi:MAG: hypothetical protein AAF441_04270 [Pseudomonadota bacterium]